MNKALASFVALIFFISTGTSSAQNIILKIHTAPANADVFLNEKKIGHTPYAQRGKFEFKKVSKYELRISKPGFEDTSFFYDVNVMDQLKKKQGGRKDEFVTEDYGDVIQMDIILKRKPCIFDSVKKIVFGFDKMIFDVKEGTKIGVGNYRGGITAPKTDIFWNPAQYGTLEFNKIAEDMLDSAGLTVVKSVQLFSDEKIEKNPDLLIGASLKGISLNYQSYEIYQEIKKVDLKLSIEWQIFNVKKNKVIAKVNTKDTLLKFRGTLVDAFRETFELGLADLLNSGDFKKTISEYKSKAETKIANKEISLLKVNRPSFQDYSKMVSSSVKSTVTIKSDIGHGSGFFISSDGLIMTNYHVIEKAKDIEVIMNAGFSLPAQVISYDEDYDVAIIKVIGNGYKPLFLKDTDEVTIGEEVIVIGTPKEIELGQSVSKGIISGKREFENKQYIQTDASVNGGNSGGPLLDIKGEVLGIVSRKYYKQEGLNFAIPINVAIQKLHITFK